MPSVSFSHSYPYRSSGGVFFGGGGLGQPPGLAQLGSGSGFLKGGTRVLRVTQGGEIGRGEVKDEKKKSINWM